jgi:hypothetical protein
MLSARRLYRVISLGRDRLVGVVSLAVGEQVVDEHADNGEEEDDKSPEDLVGNRAV